MASTVVGIITCVALLHHRLVWWLDILEPCSGMVSLILICFYDGSLRSNCWLLYTQYLRFFLFLWREIVGERIHIELLKGLKAIEDSFGDATGSYPSSKQPVNHLNDQVHSPLGEKHQTQADSLDDVPSEATAHDPRTSHIGEIYAGNHPFGGQEAPFPKPDTNFWWHSPPLMSNTKLVGKLVTPTSLRVDSPAVRLLLQGWETSKGYTVLTSPVAIEADLSPSFAALVINRLNPLLGHTATLQPGTRFRAKLVPPNSIWPSQEVDVLVEPLDISIGKGSIVARSLDVLSSFHRPIAQALRNRSTFSVVTGPFLLHMDNDGKVKTKRLDIEIGKL